MPKRILIASAEKECVELRKEQLEEAGFEVLTAENHKTALDLIRKNNFDLVLIDYFLPRMGGGVELYEKIQKDEKLKKIKCVICSATNQDHIHPDDWPKIKGLEFISELLDNEEFIGRIKKLIG